MEDIIVIGAGPSGLMAAIQASYLGASVTVLEHNDRPLKKLYATGNGRCNFSNLYMDDKVYRGRDPEFAYGIIDDFDRNDLLLFFHNLGMTTRHIGDYLYPRKEQARTVADVLLLECRRLNVRIICGENVVNITREKGFCVTTDREVYHCSSLILAPGGMASPSHGSDGSLNGIIKKLGIGFVEQKRALVPLLHDDKEFKKLAGVRIKCMVSLLADGQKESSERGEIMINKDNISGIPIMQLSRYATQALDEGRKVYVVIDLFPDESEDELNRLVYNAFRGYRYACAVMQDVQDKDREGYDRTGAEALSLILNEKLAMYCLNRTGISSGAPSVKVPDKKIGELTGLMKGLRIRITGDAGWDRAQVTAGGVDTAELSEGMEVRKIPGLYVVGELADIDGTCGGYNLQWAFSSGAAAGRSAGTKIRGKRG